MNHASWRRVATGIAVSLGGFQIALAAGAPWGSAAWGGGHPGVLPTGLRLASAGAGAFWLIAALGLSRPGLPTSVVGAWGIRALAAFAGASVVLNAVSASPPERLWSPVSLVLAVACWQLSRVPPDRRDIGIRS